MTDWYRHKTWSDEDETEFHRKLNKARKIKRAQYLRIQAVELVATKTDANMQAAQDLLTTLLAEYPENKIERAQALQALGETYEYQGEIEKALELYRSAIDYEREFPNVQTNAYLNYAELIVKTKNLTYYEFVESLLMSKIDGLLFPIGKYKAFSILSIINYYKNNKEQARYFADLAEQNANAETSGFRYHKHLGLVKDRDAYLDRGMTDG
jgi:hypothetical protein